MAREVIGPNEPSYFRRPQASGTLVVLDVVPKERIAFQLVSDRIDAALELRAADADRTDATLVVETPWLSGVRRTFPRRALARLYELVQTGAES